MRAIHKPFLLLPCFALTTRISLEPSNLCPSTLLGKETRPQPLTTAPDARTAPRWLGPGTGALTPPRGFRGRCSGTFNVTHETPG